MITKDDIIKIGFTNHSILLLTKTTIQVNVFLPISLDWQTRVKHNKNYTVSPFGLHWEELDEDEFQRFLLTIKIKQ